MGFLGGHIQNQVATKFFDAFVSQICRTPILFYKICIFQELGGRLFIDWEDPEILNFQ